MMRRAVTATLAVSLVGCALNGDGSDPVDGTWVGTITTEGNVTTVVSESGSVWGGTATLVEEASIGVAAGADAHMFGEVRGVTATDRLIYVVDLQVPALREYDWDGNWLRDFGRSGQGPGEFQYPTGVGVDGLGRVWVHEQVLTRMVVFSPDGEALATRNIGGMRIDGNPEPLTVTSDGHAYVFDVVRSGDPDAPGGAVAWS